METTTVDDLAVLGDVGAAAAAVTEQVRASVVEVRPRRGGAGAGTIWHAGGTIVTNYHVAGRDRASVHLADGRKFDASVVAWDKRNDLAVLSVAAPDLPAARIGDARALRPGQLVLAIGHPYGVRNSVTVGVVSTALPPYGPARHGPTPQGLARHDLEGLPAAPDGAPATQNAQAQSGDNRAAGGGMPAGRARLWRWGQGRELICADVLLGPGNSGGPLVDARGRVVGINAMIGNGLALAVPSHLVDRLLARQGHPPRLGVGVQDVFIPPPLAARAGVDAGPAPMVIEIVAGSPAERAGLFVGDVLIAVDGIDLDGGEALPNALEAHGSGPVQLKIVRGGAAREVAVHIDVDPVALKEVQPRAA